MKDMVARLRLCYVATVTPDGKPNLSPKGSLKVLDDEHLAFADIMSPQTMRNLAVNPHIEVNMVDPFLRRGYRFKGSCEVHREGAVFDSVGERLADGRPYLMGDRFTAADLTFASLSAPARLLFSITTFGKPHST